MRRVAQVRGGMRRGRVVPALRLAAAQRAASFGKVQPEVRQERSGRRQRLLDRQDGRVDVEQRAQQVFESRFARCQVHCLPVRRQDQRRLARAQAEVRESRVLAVAPRP